MATIDDVVNIARTYLRDFPRFFQTSFAAAGRTYQVGHVNIDTDSLYVATYLPGSASASVVTNYSVDERNGVIRFATTPAAGANILIEGYYYEWVTPTDLQFYTQRAVEKHLHVVNTPLEALSDVVINAIGISAIVESLWALMTEYSRDIDVITSESVHIPASQRFRMVQSLLAQWEGEYQRHASALNIGLDRLEVFNLRRVSRTTNRLVPLYKQKEFGDNGPTERLWPVIDDGVLPTERKEDDLRSDAFIDGMPPSSGAMTPNYY